MKNLVKMNEYNDIIKDRLSPIIGAGNALKETSFFIQHINSNNKLIDSTPESRFSCLINAVNIGLTLNPAAKECYLIPRGDKCTLMPSYIGLQKLIQTVSGINQILVEVVYKDDNVEKYEPTDVLEPIVFKPDPFAKRIDKDIIGVFALAIFPDGRKQVESMNIDDIKKVMAMSESYQFFQREKENGKRVKCVWADHFPEMCKKSVIKRIYKRLPRVGDQSKVDEAISIDNEDYKASDNQRYLIERLVSNSTLEEHQKVQIEREMFQYNNTEASMCIELLKNNQLSGIGNATSMATINETINEKVEMVNT